MKIAIVSDTPYQIFNAIRLAKYNVEFKNAEIDLFVGHQFFHSNELVERMKKYDIFENIYGFYPQKNVNRVHRIIETVNPKYGIRKLLKSYDSFPDFNYELIFLSLISEMSLNLLLNNTNARVYYYDDGSGSYSRRMKPTSIISKSNQLLYKLLGKNLDKINIIGLYLNNPKMYNSDDFKTEELHKIDPENRCDFEMIREIFEEGNPELYKNHKMIYLTDPDIADDYKVCNAIVEIADDVLVRPHPRTVDYNVYQGQVDYNPGMWEMISLECINGDSVLVGGYSTAQFIPFFLFGKEPKLVFTYKLISTGFSDDLINSIESMIESIKGKYSDESKIIVINNYYELNMLAEI